ncbi:hypothetical protein MASR1M45_08180 [Candidatus Kapaibacterium sp.]
MTDADGYYKFTRLKKGNYVVKAMNKYFDGLNILITTNLSIIHHCNTILT